MTSKAFGLAQLGNAYSDGALSNRSKIINGAMTIDQRNAGAAVATGFAVDRFEFQENGGAVFTAERSSVAPDGFQNSLLMTVTSSASATAAQVNRVLQRIEGFNVADFGFGAAGAKTITLSFWVRSSLTGTYCVAFVNGAADRSYVSEYSVSAANTWEYKTITVSGDVTGTWAKDNTNGLQVTWDLGSGSDYNATAGAWAAGNDWRTVNQVDFANTSGTTFYITGVQLEAGDTATPFEHRSYGQELALCQRYFQRIVPRGNSGGAQTTTTGFFFVPLQTTMRTDPTVSVSGTIICDDLFATTVLSTVLGGVSSNPQSLQVLLSSFSPAVGPVPRPMQLPASNTGVLLCSSEL